VHEICPEKETTFNIVSSSRATMTQRVEDTGTDLFNSEKIQRI